jgi:hypothetical protein
MAEQQNFPLGTTARYIAASQTEQKKISNGGAGTIYYDDTPAVSSGTNDGSIVTGASATFATGVWIASASTSQAWVFDAVGDVATEDVTVSDDLTVGGDFDVGGDAIIADDLTVTAGPLALLSDTTTNLSGITLGSAADTQVYRSGVGQVTINGSGGYAGQLALGAELMANSYVRFNNAGGEATGILGHDGSSGAAALVLGSGLDVFIKRVAASVLLSNAAVATSRTTIPADGDLSAGQMAIWFDATNGAAKLKIKAKEAGGTVRVGEVALT